MVCLARPACEQRRGRACLNFIAFVSAVVEVEGVVNFFRNKDNRDESEGDASFFLFDTLLLSGDLIGDL